MISTAKNKAMTSAPQSKSEERRSDVQTNETLEEFYFSASNGRPPVTIKAKSRDEAEAEYLKTFNQ